MLRRLLLQPDQGPQPLDRFGADALYVGKFTYRAEAAVLLAVGDDGSSFYRANALQVTCEILGRSRIDVDRALPANRGDNHDRRFYR